jgi:hypothetical protein
MKARWKGCLAFLVPLLLAPALLDGAPAEERASDGARREVPKEASSEKAPAAQARVAAPASVAGPSTPEAPAEPKSIKDRVAIWVFLAWVWGTTLVSIVFLRLKIKECDRLQAMAFHEASRRPPQEGQPAA